MTVTCDCSAGMNCLTNDGSHISSWAEDSSGAIGQTILPDEQCKLVFDDPNRSYLAVSRVPSTSVTARIAMVTMRAENFI